MIYVVDSNHHLRPYTFNDEYTILSNEEAIFGWAIEFIPDMVFGPIVDAIEDAVDSYTHGILSATGKAKNDLIATVRWKYSTSSWGLLAD